MIMLKPRTTDLLKAERVNKLFNTSITMSIALQRHMGLMPHPKADFRFTFDSCFTTRPTLSVLASDKANTLRVNADWWQLTRTIKLSPKARRMLICQPPVKEFRVVITCCNTTSIVASDSGITYQHRITAGEQIQAKHLLCPHAPQSQLNAKGYVTVAAHLRGLVTVWPGDPELRLMEDLRAREKVLAAKCLARGAVMRAYTAAKQAGECSALRNC